MQGSDPENTTKNNQGAQFCYEQGGPVTYQQTYPINYSFPRLMNSNTISSGSSRGGAQTTTTTQYEEQTITTGEAFSSEESWGTATAVDSAHAADLWFSYTVQNTGTDYAREIANLAFNIYLDDAPNPIVTYFVGPDLGADPVFRNFQPGETHSYTSRHIPLTLEQMKQIDLGGTIRIELEDFSFGSDELFYNNALAGNLQLAIEDDVEDGDESIDHFLIPAYAGDTVTDILGRYFPHAVDSEGNLVAIWTPEYRQDVPAWCAEPQVVGAGENQIVWCKHALTTADWWNIYTDNLGDGTQPLQETPAVGGATALFRFNADSDLDGYSNRSEVRLNTDPNDANSFPQPELLAGVHSIRNGNNIVATLSLLNTGLYDAYGVEAVMIAPDDSITITNNTVGGSGRVRTGKEVVVGSRILAPVYTTATWLGTAKPLSAGYFIGIVDKTYAFSVNCSLPAGCQVGSDEFSLTWNDGNGNNNLVIPATYKSPTLVSVGTDGLKVSMLSGKVFNGNTFTIEARTPRDTFQYTINTEPYTLPVVIVSYNDPQGNHRFVIPAEAMSLTAPTDDLLAYSGEMLDIRGVEIVTDESFSPGANTTSLVVDNPSNEILVDAHLFLEFIDGQGVVVEEVSSTQNMPVGPGVVDINWDTANFDPAYDPEQDYIVMAFWTDYEGNILDAVGRPLSSFQMDPQAQFAMSESDSTWDIGAVSQGTLLQRRFTFANTGEREMLTYVEAPAGLSVSQVGSREVNVADQTSYDILLNTEGLAVGVFNQIITIHTSDPANITRTVLVTGTIVEGIADVPAGTLERPLDYAVTVPAPQSQGSWYNFEHPLGPDVSSLHPIKVFNQDYTNQWGVGRYATSFSAGTASYEMFGDGRDGALTISANTTDSPIDSTCSGASGTYTLSASNAGFAPGQAILIHQTRGVNSGNWMINKITAYSAGTITLSEPLNATYSSGAQVLVLKQYTNVIVNSGVTWTAKPWNGATGGILAYIANGTTTVTGVINLSGKGFRGGQSPSGGNRLNGYNGEGLSGTYGSQPTAAFTNYGTVGGGGAYNNGADAGSGGGGGGYATNGSNGVMGHSSNGSGPGAGGYIAGGTDLTTMTFGGGGGSGSTAYNSTIGGGGGSGGSVLFISTANLIVTGGISSGGAPGGNGGSGYSGGGGGGAGGSILIRTQTANISANKVTALGGSGGNGGDGVFNMMGGSGGSGRIHIDYCESLSGNSNPVASSHKLNCYMAEQVETSPTFTRLNLPQNFTTDTTYAIQYGRRIVFTGSGDQTNILRVPGNLLSSATMDILISGVGTGSLTISLDIGNDGSTDYTWTGSVTDSMAVEDLQLAPAFNRWWAANGRPTTGTMDVPVKVTLSKAGQVLLTDLKVIASGSSLRFVQLDSAAYDNVTLDYALTGASGPIAVGVDIGDDGSVDVVYTAETPANPEPVTTTDLSTFINAYLADKTGPVNVPIRFHLPSGISVHLQNFIAQKAGNLDVSLTADDILLPVEPPTEGTEVPITVTLHNAGTLPSGSVVAAFFAVVPGMGDWYIGSTLVNTVPGNSSTTASINWDTMGFTGDTIVKVIVDPYMRLSESDETNNTAQASLVIHTRPDLTATSFDLSDNEPVVGEAVTLLLIETNQGETDAIASVASVYDGSPTEGGVLLGEGTVEVMGGSSAILDFTWVPDATGWHRLFVVSDEDNQVFEYDESNNQIWLDVYVGVAGPLLLDSGTASDPIYSAVSGHGYIDINQPDEIGICGGDLPEQTFRRDPDGEVVYQFDHLQPGHFYHLDIMIFECDGAGRQQTILVDDNPVSGIEDLGDGQVHRLSLRLDPALYADRTITVTIHADGIDGAVVSEVNLHDIDYRYADAGGGADPQYPDTGAFGWLDGSPITTWGTLPYKSVRVDQSDNNVRYQFDGLNPNKRYNVHFTFWQPSGTARIQKVQIDGVDTGETVNTGDYILHQVSAAVPLNAYSSDGSIVVSIVRTNASTGAMVNEIALEEETIAVNADCIVQETPYFSETYGTVLISDNDAPIGSVIQAVSPRGDTVGCFTVTTAGNYGFLRIYGEDTTATPPIPGMRAGEMVGFKVNGASAVAAPLFYWSNDYAAHNVNLNAGNITGQSLLLQPGWNLISLNVEPPAPIVSTVLQSINGRYDRVLGEYGIYVPSLPEPFNTLRELHSSTGYYVRVTGTTSVNLLVEGIAQCSVSIDLHTGWNWIGGPCATYPVATALQSIDGHYQRVLSLTKTYDPALPLYSTLKDLKPGEGYLIYITDPVTLTYPTGSLLSEVEPDYVEAACSSVYSTPSATLVYGQIDIMGWPAAVGSVVEFVTPRGEVAGCSVITEGGLLAITQVYGADDNGIGFHDGEPIQLRINGRDLIEPINLAWRDDKTPHYIQAEVPGNTIFIPVIVR